MLVGSLISVPAEAQDIARRGLCADRDGTHDPRTGKPLLPCAPSIQASDETLEAAANAILQYSEKIDRAESIGALTPSAVAQARQNILRAERGVTSIRLGRSGNE